MPDALERVHDSAGGKKRMSMPRSRYFRGETIPSFIVDQNGCWIWTRLLNGGARYAMHAGQYVHRLHWEAFNGPIPDGYEIDHLCRVRCCVNPAHLEAVTHVVNARRGMRGNMVTHCPKGHEYTKANTWWWSNGTRAPHRHCKTCKKLRRPVEYANRNIRRRLAREARLAQRSN